MNVGVVAGTWPMRPEARPLHPELSNEKVEHDLCV